MHAAGSCDAVNVWPPIVTNAVRPPALFAATLIVMVPFPLPDEPPVTVSHDGSLLAALHEHQLPAVTAIEPPPPALANDWLEGDSAVPQLAGSCVTGHV